MKKDKRIIQAQKDFDDMIKNSSKEEIEKARSSCYGIAACKFALQYVPRKKYIEPKLTEEHKIYKKIYNIYFNYFENK